MRKPKNPELTNFLKSTLENFITQKDFICTNDILKEAYTSLPNIDKSTIREVCQNLLVYYRVQGNILLDKSKQGHYNVIKRDLNKIITKHIWKRNDKIFSLVEKTILSILDNQVTFTNKQIKQLILQDQTLPIVDTERIVDKVIRHYYSKGIIENISKGEWELKEKNFKPLYCIPEVI